VVDVGDREGDDLHAVAVLALVDGDRRVRVQRAGEHEADAALLEDVRDAVARAGLEAGVGDLAEAEGVDVVVGRLERVADVQLDVVDPVQRHEVLLGAAVDGGGGGRLLGHGSSPRALV
jgi:hypothetical protein